MITWNVPIRLLQGLLGVLLAPLVFGLLQTIRARLSRRQGPWLLQPSVDLLKLLGKFPAPGADSWVFDVAPAVVFSCCVGLGIVAPVFHPPSAAGGVTADLLALVYLLGLARLVSAWAGFAAGAPFGGLGSSREMFTHILVEPPLLAVCAALSLTWRTTDLSAILAEHWRIGPEVYRQPTLLLLIPALWLTILVETNRLPFDNPASPLELSVFGGTIELEYSGRQLALWKWAAWARLTFLLALFCSLFIVPVFRVLIPDSAGSKFVYLLLVVVTLVGAVVVLAVWEGWQAKLRVRAQPGVAMVALIFAVVALLLALAASALKQGGG
jgi:formate hydrogenlyase subunit 4